MGHIKKIKKRKNLKDLCAMLYVVAVVLPRHKGIGLEDAL